MLFRTRNKVLLFTLIAYNFLRMPCCFELHLDEEVCGIGWKPFGKSCYKTYTERKRWVDSAASCKLHDAYLVHVSSKAELHFLYHSFVRPLRSGSAWIGLSRQNNSFYWKKDGSKLTYANWNYGEPNNVQGKENCVEIFADSGGWNDIPCSYKRPYVCERDAVLAHPVNQMSSLLRNKDHALANHTIEVHDVKDITQCFHKCLTNENCFSFNFGYSGKFSMKCELNNSTRAWARGAFVFRHGFSYYD